jgi:ArsR family transcriptional regulator
MIEFTQASLDEHTAIHVAELFRAFSDTSRVRILYTLTSNSMNVQGLANMLNLSESAASHHLRWLRQLGLIESQRKGKEVYYSITDEHLIALFREGVKHIRDG